MRRSIESMRNLIMRQCAGCADGGGRIVTSIEGLTLARWDEPSVPIGTIYRPVVCLVAQGGKRLMLGDRVFDYDTATYLIVSVDLPVTGGVSRASPQEPYVGLSLALDRAALAGLVLDMAADDPPDLDPPLGLAVSPVTVDLLEPVLRLLHLLDRPRDIAILAPLTLREINYRLLLGDQGGRLRQIAVTDSRLSHVARAIAWIRENFAEPFRIEDLAEIAGMSVSVFHRHFKAVTTLSPLQYRNRVRLQEARRLLLTQVLDVAHVGFSVGYDSPSQFSRDYSRLFGAPPARDAARLREFVPVGAAREET